MAPWGAPAAAAALLLIATGLAKLMRPDAGAAALPLASTKASTVVTRGLGVLELGVAIGVLSVGGRGIVAAMAVLFAAFAGFAWFALRAGATSCGCTGAIDSPPTYAHVAMNMAFALFAGLAAGTSAPSSMSALARAAADPVDVVVIAMTLVVAWLAWMVLDLGALQSLGRRQEGRTT